MALAHDVHLRRRRLHGIAPPPHHRLEEVPARIAGELEQALVHRGQRDLTPRRGRLPVRGARGDAHAGALARLVHRAVRRHRDLQLEGAPAHLDLGNAELEGGPPEVDERGGPDPGDAAADDEGRDEDVRRMRGHHRHLDHGLLAAECHDARLEHALALDGDQRRRLAERHAHLQARGVAGLVAPLLRHEVDPVAVADLEPPLVVTGDPHFLVGGDAAAGGIHRCRLQHEPTRGGRHALAIDQPLGIGDAPAERPGPADLLHVLVGVEAADQALAVGVEGAREDVHLDGRAGDGRAAHVDHGHLSHEALARRRPALGLQADEIGGGPERHPRRHGLGLAARVAELQLGEHVPRRGRLRQALDGGARRARGVEDQRLALVNPRRAARPLATGVGRALARIILVQHLVAARAAAHDAFRERAIGERELLEALGRRHALGIHLGAEHDGQARRAPAGQVLDAQVEGEFRHGDERRGGRAQHRFHERHAKLLDLKPPGRELGR